MLRRLLVLISALLIQGCTTAPVIPEGYAGPTATIADSATGGGSSGGVFFALMEANGRPVAENSHSASLAASRGRGADLQVQQVERKVVAGKSTLKLFGRVAYAAPIQEIFRSSQLYSVGGVIDIELRPDARYRVTGILDAFRREIWLEEEGSKQIIGQKIIGKIEPEAVSKAAADSSLAADSSFTCCNLRYDGDWISDANWATLPFVPAGSRIKINNYGRYRASVTIEGRPLRIGQDYGREQESKEQFVAKLVVKEDPNLRVATFPADVQAAIRAGKVMPGMTKEQVIISLGYPRTDMTRSTDLPEWSYWTYTDEEYVVVWDTDQRVKEINGSLRIKRLVVYTQ